MPVTSVTGRRRKLVEPLRDCGAIGRLGHVRVAAFIRHQNSHGGRCPSGGRALPRSVRRDCGVSRSFVASVAMAWLSARCCFSNST